MASNPGQVPAGGRDKIGVTVSTESRGGSVLNKTITVTTNDPQNPQVQLVVSGKVKAYITVKPSYVRLMGEVGEEMTSVVEITPSETYPFTIKKVEAQEGDHIQFDLKPAGGNPAKDGYRLHIRNIKRDEGAYRDFITIETDLKQKPTLRIPVHGRIIGNAAGGGAEASGEPKTH